MDAVIEIDEVGQVVNADPVQRLVVAKTLAHRLEERCVSEQHRVAVHTRLCWRDSRERRRLDRRMAVPAINAVVGDVVQVTELERLFDEDVLAGDVARSGEHDRQ